MVVSGGRLAAFHEASAAQYYSREQVIAGDGGSVIEYLVAGQRPIITYVQEGQ